MTYSLYNDAKQYVEQLLKDMNKQGFLFHNREHTQEVVDRVKYLCEKEKISNELKELVMIAALFHDTGFLHQYENHEIKGVEVVEQYLLKHDWFFGERMKFDGVVDKYFSDDKDIPKYKLELIKQLIMATIPYSKPSNKLEEIIKDADIDNFGRTDFFDKGKIIRDEIKRIKGIKFTDKKRYTSVFNIMENVRFYTDTQIQERGEQFAKNKERLVYLMENASDT